MGKNEQGMSQALSVEKTSKRGGRIIHEKDLMPPPMFGESFKTPKDIETTPPHLPETDEYGDPITFSMTNPESVAEEEQDDDDKPSITELMKNPSKVVMCKVRIIQIRQ